MARCDTCAVWVHPPRPRCPRCLGTDLSWRAPGEDFRLYSWALHRAAGNAPARMVVLVDIADGLRVMANLLEPYDGIIVDHHVELVWTPLDVGRSLANFRLARPTLHEEPS